MKIRDGDDHEFYHQFNGIDSIKYVIVAYSGGVAVACGAIKQFNSDVMEVKRMYVPKTKRGNGYATKVLVELEKWANEMKFEKCILETGYQQPEAISLYKKCGYRIVENYGQYKNVENSVCFEKLL